MGLQLARFLEVLFPATRPEVRAAHPRSARALVYLCRTAPLGKLPDTLAHTPWGRLVLSAAVRHLSRGLVYGTFNYDPEDEGFVFTGTGEPAVAVVFHPARNPWLEEYVKVKPEIDRIFGSLDVPEPPCAGAVYPARWFLRRSLPAGLLEELHEMLHERNGRLEEPLRHAALTESIALAAVYACDRLQRDPVASPTFLQRVAVLRNLSPLIGMPALRHELVPSCRSSAKKRTTRLR